MWLRGKHCDWAQGPRRWPGLWTKGARQGPAAIHTSTHPHIHTSTHPLIHTSTHPHIHRDVAPRLGTGMGRVADSSRRGVLVWGHLGGRGLLTAAEGAWW